MGQSKEAKAAVDRYRQRAEEMRDMALSAKSAAIKDEFQSLAKKYDKLADDVTD